MISRSSYYQILFPRRMLNISLIFSLINIIDGKVQFELDVLSSRYNKWKTFEL